MLLVASLLLVAMPFVPSSFLLEGKTSSLELGTSKLQRNLLPSLTLEGCTQTWTTHLQNDAASEW